MDCHTPGFPLHHYRSLLKLMSIQSVMPSSHLILCHPLLLLPPIPPSFRVFINNNGQMWFADLVDTLRHCVEYDLLDLGSGLYQKLQHPQAVL